MSEQIQILIVEDDETIRDTLAFTLQQEGYQVLAIDNGQTALELLYPQGDRLAPAVDLVVLDIMLPGLNGLDLCRFLRRQNNVVPILMLSAKGSEIDRVVGLEVGADDYLVKPFGMRELIARCRALLRRQRARAQVRESVLTWGDLILYSESCRVTLHGQDVALTPKEYRLLELLMQNPRQVWNREQLIERVWGEDFMGDTKTVDVHIRWLREKLEADPSHPRFIVTVRGFGYRFG